MSMPFLLFSWFPVGVWAGVIFYFSHIPHLESGLDLWDFPLRKIAHMVEFAVLTLLLLRAMKRTWPHWGKLKILLWACGASVLYAAADELHQFYVPGRGPSFGDVLIDGCGVLICVLIYLRYQRFAVRS